MKIPEITEISNFYPIIYLFMLPRFSMFFVKEFLIQYAVKRREIMNIKIYWKYFLKNVFIF